MTRISHGLSSAAEVGSVSKAESTNSTEGAWTRYVQALAKGSDETDTFFQEAWMALRQALTWELRYRSLLERSPAFVGVYGAGTWDGYGAARQNHPLEEFLHDCFSFVFVERIPHLLSRLKVNPDIEGDVRLHIRNFVHQRQKTHDPLGARLFDLLRSAVEKAIAAKELYVLSGDPSIRNDTTLSFTPRSLTPAHEELGDLASDWATGQIGDLFSIGPGSRQRAEERLRAQLLALRLEGVEIFRFQAAIDGLKRDVRAQLAVLFELEQGDTVLEIDMHGNETWIRSLQPETWVEDIDSYKKLVDCVSRFVREVEKERTRRYLEALWGLLRRFVNSSEVKLPTHRGIERVLKVPRARVGDLLETLGKFVRNCSGSRSGNVIDGHFRDSGPESGS